MTGSAVDLLEGSSAEIENCLFVGDLLDTHIDDRVNLVKRWKPEHGSGGLAFVLRIRTWWFRRCTFTGNRNGIDDSSTGSRYEDFDFLEEHGGGRLAAGRAV